MLMQDLIFHFMKVSNSAVPGIYSSAHQHKGRNMLLLCLLALPMLSQALTLIEKGEFISKEVTDCPGNHHNSEVHIQTHGTRVLPPVGASPDITPEGQGDPATNQSPDGSQFEPEQIPGDAGGPPETPQQPAEGFLRQINEQGQHWIVLTSNGLPDHPVGQCKADLSQMGGSQRYIIPDVPTTRPDDPPPTEMNCVGSMVGILKNGVPLFSALNVHTSPGIEDHTTPWNFDNCQGHITETIDGKGVYHYHFLSPCIYKDNEADVFLGVALDGYPIYGPIIGSLNGAWASNEMLDECHGNDFGDGLGYRYIANTIFPYTIGCFRGRPDHRQTQTSACSSRHSRGHICPCPDSGNGEQQKPDSVNNPQTIDTKDNDNKDDNDNRGSNTENEVSSDLQENEGVVDFAKLRDNTLQEMNLLRASISFWKSNLVIFGQRNADKSVQDWIGDEIKVEEDKLAILQSLWMLYDRKIQNNELQRHEEGLPIEQHQQDQPQPIS